MKWTVSLRASPTAVRPTRAWWLPTLDPARLLAELIDWPVAQTDVRLYFTGEGVLIVPAAGDVAAVSAREYGGIHFGCLADRVYVPVDAQLVPSLSDQEVAALLPDEEGVYLWRPGRGVIRFDSLGIKHIEDLVHIPQAATDDAEPGRWDAARVAETLPNQLIEISLLQRLDISQVFGGAELKIGAAADRWDQLPPSEQETTPAKLAAAWSIPFVLGVVVVALVAFALFVLLAWCPLVWRLVIVASVVLLMLLLKWSFHYPRTRALWRRVVDALQSWLASRPEQPGRAPVRPATGGTTGQRQVVAGNLGGSGGFLGGLGAKLRGWLDHKRRELTSQLDSLRHREVERLLNLLDHDPDEGLRFAMPLTGQHHPRGIAPFGVRLASRTPDFSLRGLAGTGGPADIWQVSDQYRARLHQKYRDLANREIQLGRRRRAAYILAELLGDLRAAAATLADGGHFREAAALYEQKLGDPSNAAACLARGGLLVEAIAIYERLGQFETVGELYEKLGRQDDAARAYRTVVSAQLNAGDYLAAAQLLEAKLQSPDEALDALQRGWPGSVQAERCLRETYNLWGRLGRHDQAQRALAHLFVDHAQTLQGLVLARVLADVAQQYPDPATRRAAADRVRRIASKRLADANAAERQGLVEAVGSLDQTDRLLTRDCQRFHRQNSKNPTPRSSTQARRTEPVRALSSLHLPAADWKTILAWGGAFYAAGWRDHELVIVRGPWDRRWFAQRPTPPSWKLPNVESRDLLLTGSGVLDGPLLVHCVGSDPLHLRGEFPETDRLRRREIRGVNSAQANLTHCHLDEHGLMHYVRVTPFEIIVERYRAGALLSVWSTDHPTMEFDPGELSETATPPEPHWLIAQKQLFLGSGRQLAIWDLGLEKASPVTLRFSHTITGLHASRPGQSSLLAVSLQLGGELLDITHGIRRISVLGAHLHAPLACFTDHGRLFAADERFVECFEVTNDAKMRFLGSVPRNGEAPVALCCLPDNSQIATLDAKGQITIYQAD